MVTQVVVLMTLVIATYTDLKGHKIYNKLVFPMLIAGLLYQYIAQKTVVPVSALQGMLIAFALLPFFALNMIGAGDIKLFMVVGVWLGFQATLSIMIYAVLAGGVVALGLMLARKNGLKRLSTFFHI